MKSFKSVAALHSLLTTVCQAGGGAADKDRLLEDLATALDLERENARLLTWTLLSDNLKESADRVRENADRLMGTWQVQRTESGGSIGFGGNMLISQVDSWSFQDFRYTHTKERQLSYMSPYGSRVQPSSSTEERGIWVPPDRTGPSMEIAAISEARYGRHLTVDWLGSNQLRPEACLIDGTRFARTR